MVFRMIDKYLQVKPTESRILLIVIMSMFLVHVFACIFYFASRMNDFDSNTWMGNNSFIDIDTSPLVSYFVCMYWAFQTLTTVGYGDFGAYNTLEIYITLVWMFLGVAFYSFVVGSLTTVMTSVHDSQENLQNKLNALEDFSKESQLDDDLHFRVKNFLINNHTELFARIDEDQMIQELPPTFKEEVLFHQYGSLIYDLNFL